MSAAYALRRAGPGDEAALSLVGSGTFLEAFAGVLPAADILAHCTHEHAPGRYGAWLEAGHPVWIAEVGGAPVGYLVLCPPDLPLADIDDRDIEMKRIYVFARFQGRGVGRALTEAAVEAARAIGKRRLLLGVYGRNEQAIGFYRANGFEVVGTRRFTVGANTHDDLVLARAL